jgi:serine/threonine protein phosphatase PrpC
MNISGNNCKYIVIASDGVWEFLSNEKIMEIVNWYYKNNDSTGAAEKIVEESIKRWKQEDDVVDDVTCIVIFFNKNL